MMEAQPKPLIDRLFDVHEGRCHWCDRTTQRTPLKKGKPTPGNYATVDHVYPRNDERRQNKPSGAVAHVLSCFNCNQERGDKPYSLFLMIKKPEWRAVLA